ncbi:hypothetical protein [Methylobacterium durans]|uniref:hypothetical protein n=1 Tax=Methylobacterium durans TaxID=2202825 RepID=UPI0013A57954|nr:hypothetical protein [Methylobacterium durans]
MDRYRITGNDLSRNLTSGLFDEGTGRKIVRDNIDWSDQATWVESPPPTVNPRPERSRFGWPRR